jgi:hypothetical protein
MAKSTVSNIPADEAGLLNRHISRPGKGPGTGGTKKETQTNHPDQGPRQYLETPGRKSPPPSHDTTPTDEGQGKDGRRHKDGTPNEKTTPTWTNRPGRGSRQTRTPRPARHPTTTKHNIDRRPHPHQGPARGPPGRKRHTPPPDAVPNTDPSARPKTPQRLGPPTPTRPGPRD